MADCFKDANFFGLDQTFSGISQKAKFSKKCFGPNPNLFQTNRRILLPLVLLYVEIVLEMSKLFRTGPKITFQYFLTMSNTIWACPKQFGRVQNNLDVSKTIEPVKISFGQQLTQVVYSQTSVKLITFSILDHFQWENGHNPLQQSWITIKSQPFPPKKFDLSVLSIWIGNRINCVISEVQVSKKFFFIFLASKKLLASLRSEIGTCSVFCHSCELLSFFWPIV